MLWALIAKAGWPFFVELGVFGLSWDDDDLGAPGVLGSDKDDREAWDLRGVEVFCF